MGLHSFKVLWEVNVSSGDTGPDECNKFIEIDTLFAKICIPCVNGN